MQSTFLRRILAFDAISSGAMALLVLVGAGFLESWLGVPAAFQRGAGAILIPFAAFVGWLAMKPEQPRPLVWCVIAVNVLWAVESVLTLMTGWFSATTLGVIFVVGQAAFVALMAELQVLGLKKSQTAAA